jgi:hypothetical protein
MGTADFSLLAASTASAPRDAVADLVAQWGGRAPDFVMFFTSVHYELGELGDAFARAFDCAVAGCTTAGQIGPGGFARHGICAVAFFGGVLKATPHLIHPLADGHSEAKRIARRIGGREGIGMPGPRRFGLLLCDGLSKSEERLAAALYQAVGAFPIVGGSAGDDLAFDRTFVYHDGRFLSDAAVYVDCETTAPVVAFKLQHFRPTAVKLVVTDTDSRQRTIYTLDGMPANEAYANALGISSAALDAKVFASHPLMIRIGDDYYVRSVCKANADGSLNCLSAVETGTIVALAEAEDPIATVERAFDDVISRVGEPAVILAFDCVLRRFDLESAGLLENVGALFAARRVVGFSTYGEQFNGQHINQTLCGIALARPR